MGYLSCWLVLFLFLAQPALANEASARAPASVPDAKGEKGVGRDTTLFETKPSPARLPTYVADWDHLAELTRSDPAVFARADHWAYRREHAIWSLGSVALLSGGVAVAGTFVRLDTDHWTKTTKWSVAGGLTVAVVSFLTAWAISTDRSDLESVITQWNLRHPDRPLAP